MKYWTIPYQVNESDHIEVYRAHPHYQIQVAKSQLKLIIRPVHSTRLLDFTEFLCFFLSNLYQCMVTVLKLHWPPSTFACKCLSTSYISV